MGEIFRECLRRMAFFFFFFYLSTNVVPGFHRTLQKLWLELGSVVR